MSPGSPLVVPDDSVLTFDSAPIIYYLQDHPEFAPKFAPLFEGISQGRLSGVVSTITLAEVMAGPLQEGKEMLAAQYREVLSRAAGWQMMAVDEDIAAEAARLRARYRLRLPDAIQVATAIVSRSYALVTHDAALARVGEIRILGLA